MSYGYDIYSKHLLQNISAVTGFKILVQNNYKFVVVAAAAVK